MRGEPRPQDDQTGSALIEYKEVNAIFETSLIEGTRTKERVIYVNEARKNNYPTTLTSPPSPLGRPIYFSEKDAYIVHFLHNDALTMHIGCCSIEDLG